MCTWVGIPLYGLGVPRLIVLMPGCLGRLLQHLPLKWIYILDIDLTLRFANNAMYKLGKSATSKVFSCLPSLLVFAFLTIWSWIY